MKKPTPTTAVSTVISKSADVFVFDPAALTSLARTVSVQLDGTVAERIDQAAMHSSRSLRHELACGLLLISIKAECDHGEFVTLLESRGFEARGAQQSMQLARFVIGRSEEEREQLIGVQKSKVVQLASADPEVINALLDQGIDKIDALSVRALRHRLQDMTASAADIAVQRDTAEAEAAGLRKQLARQPGDRDDKLPLMVVDLRAEIMALGKKADLAISGFYGLGIDLINLRVTDEMHDWADATLRLAVSQLGALRLHLDGVLKSYLRELPGEDPSPTEQSYLTKQEVLDTARRFGELTQVHTYEHALRDWDRAQQRPRGKGRPAAKPVAPGGEA